MLRLGSFFAILLMLDFVTERTNRFAELLKALFFKLIA